MNSAWRRRDLLSLLGTGKGSSTSLASGGAQCDVTCCHRGLHTSRPRPASTRSATRSAMLTIPFIPVNAADGNVHTKSVSCPTGTALTGGGIRGSNGAQITRSLDTSWQVEVSVQLGSTAKPKLFAVCATSHVTAAAMPSAVKSFPWYESGTVTVACASGNHLAGGGSSVTGPGNMRTNATTTEGSHWQVLAKGPTVAPSGVTGKVTGYAVCVTVV